MLKVLLDSDLGAQAQRAVAWLGAGNRDPFVRDSLIVQSLGVGLWLEQGLAASTGLAANLNIDLPSRFIWSELANRVPGTPAQSPFRPAVMRWAIFDALQEIPTGPDFALIRRRWHEASDADRLRLASQFSQLFDRYQIYRRDWLLAWQQGEQVAADNRQAGQQIAFGQHQAWQAWLWRQVLARVRDYAEAHPYDALQGAAAIEQSLNPARDAAAGRVVLFGLLELAPEQFRVLAEIAKTQDMIWFAPDPAQGFWEDLVSARAAAKMALQAPQAAWLYEQEPELLGDLGRQHRDFLVQLRQLEQQGLALIGDDELRTREPMAPKSRLSALQQAVFGLSNEAFEQLSDQSGSHDASLEIHCAHSLLRQCEIVHDRLLSALSELPDLRADQIALFCVDLDQAAPLVNAVFGTGDPPLLPVRIGGQGRRNDPAVRATLGFLTLVLAGANRQRLYEWFDNPWLLERLALPDDTALRLSELLAVAGIWTDETDFASGHSAAMSAHSQTDRDGHASHSFARGMERLILGGFYEHAADGQGNAVAAAAHTRLWPAPGLSRDSEHIIGLLLMLSSELADWRARANEARTLASWASDMLQWLERWLGVTASREQAIVIRAALVNMLALNESLHTRALGTVSLEAFAQALEDDLERGSTPALAQGSITVAPLGSLRGMPFRVVAVLGLDDGSWPPRQSLSEFDLASAAPRSGDRHPADAARAVFLDVLLDTKDRVMMSYTGRDARDDSVREPARVLAQLRNYLDRVAGANQVSGPFYFQHPLQAFSPRRFRSELPSFDGQWFAAARALRERSDQGDASSARLAPLTLPSARDGRGSSARSPKSATSRPLVSASATTIHLDDLHDALCRPVRSYLRVGLGVSLPAAIAAGAALEALDIADVDYFDRADLTEWAHTALSGGLTPELTAGGLACHPALPDGPHGRSLARRSVTTARESIDSLERLWPSLCQLGSDQDVSDVPSSNDPNRGERPAAELACDRLALAVDLPGGDSRSIRVAGSVGPIYRCSGGGGRVVVRPQWGDATIRTVLRSWLDYLLWQAAAPDSNDRTVLHTLIQPKDAAVAGSERPAIGFGAVFSRLTPSRSLHDNAPLRADALSRDQAMQELAKVIEIVAGTAEVPPLLFPRTCTAWLREAPFDMPIDRDGGAWRKAREAFYGGFDRTGELEDPWVQAVFRDQPPSLIEVLKYGLPIYGPIWERAHIARPRGVRRSHD